MHSLCLVIEPKPLVAEDLAELIRETAPHLKVMVVETADDPRLTEAVLASIGMAFVHTAPEQFRASALGLRLSEAGTPVIFTAADFALTDFVSRRVADVPYARRSELVLPSPFSGSELATVLQTVLAALQMKCKGSGPCAC